MYSKNNGVVSGTQSALFSTLDFSQVKSKVENELRKKQISDEVVVSPKKSQLILLSIWLSRNDFIKKESNYTLAPAKLMMGKIL